MMPIRCFILFLIVISGSVQAKERTLAMWLQDYQSSPFTEFELSNAIQLADSLYGIQDSEPTPTSHINPAEARFFRHQYVLGQIFKSAIRERISLSRLQMLLLQGKILSGEQYVTLADIGYLADPKQQMEIINLLMDMGPSAHDLVFQVLMRPRFSYLLLAGEVITGLVKWVAKIAHDAQEFDQALRFFDRLHKLQGTLRVGSHRHNPRYALIPLQSYFNAESHARDEVVHNLLTQIAQRTGVRGVSEVRLQLISCLASIEENSEVDRWMDQELTQTRDRAVAKAIVDGLIRRGGRLGAYRLALVIPQLERFLNAQHDDLIENAIARLAIHFSNDDELALSFQPLVDRFLEHPKPSVRASSLQLVSLAFYNDSYSTEKWRRAFSDSNEMVRESAYAQFFLMTSHRIKQRLLPVLKAALANETSVYIRDYAQNEIHFFENTPTTDPEEQRCRAALKRIRRRPPTVTVH